MGTGRLNVPLATANRHPAAVRHSLQSLPLPARFGRGVVLCAEGTPGGESDGKGQRDPSEDATLGKLRPAEVTPELEKEQLVDVGMRFDGFWALLDAWGRSGLSEKARPMLPDHHENLSSVNRR